MKLAGIEIPEFENQDEVLDFVETNSSKLYLHFVESDRKFERNAILAVDQSLNNEFNQVDIKHCVRCMAVVDEDYCESCDED